MEIAEETEQGVRSKESGAKASKLQAHQSVNLLLFKSLLKTKSRTGGSRPARRHSFCPGGHKKDAKKAFLLAEGNSFARFHSL